MSLTILRADRAHLDLLAPLFDGYRQFYHQSADLPAARAFLEERLALGESAIFLAVEDGPDGRAGLGFTQLYPMFSSVGMRRIWILNDLFVAAEGRRRGIGRMLMDRARQHTEETGYAKIELATQKDNQGAKALYDALGYTLDDEFDHYALPV